MNLVGLALVALTVGLLGGAVLTLVWTARTREAAGPPSEAVGVPDGIGEVLAVLRSASVLVGPGDQVLIANAAAHNFGLARGSRIGVPEVLDLVHQARRDGQTATADLALGRRNAVAALALSVRATVLNDDLLLVLADDQTAALRVEETRRDFVANVSHELKTPIGAVALLAEAVGQAADDPKAVRRFAGRMDVECSRLTELVGQIIDLSRLQGDEPLREADVVDIVRVLHEAVDRTRVDADRNGITLSVSPSSQPTVLGSTRLLTTAVQNLVQNAVAYSDPGAQVVVAACAQADDTVAITVADTGIGIAGKDLHRIFERFYRVDYARSRANGGTGLGLSIVKHIAAAHRGDISVRSDVGHGSTFTITIPAHLPRATAPSPPMAADPPVGHVQELVR